LGRGKKNSRKGGESHRGKKEHDNNVVSGCRGFLINPDRTDLGTGGTINLSSTTKGERNIRTLSPAGDRIGRVMKKKTSRMCRKKGAWGTPSEATERAKGKQRVDTYGVPPEKKGKSRAGYPCDRKGRRISSQFNEGENSWYRSLWKLKVKD